MSEAQCKMVPLNIKLKIMGQEIINIEGNKRMKGLYNPFDDHTEESFKHVMAFALIRDEVNQLKEDMPELEKTIIQIVKKYWE